MIVHRSVALVGLALALLVGSTFVRRGSSSGESVLELSGPTMGTTYLVKIDADIGPTGEKEVRAEVERRLALVNRLMSTYDSTSELSRFNRHRSTEPIRVSPELVEVLARARSISDASDGFFDVTVGPLVDAWGFGPEPPTTIPLDSATLVRLRSRVGSAGIILDHEAGTVTKTDPDVRIDLSAIAKGFGVDLVAEALERLGFDRYLVEVGGELRAGATRRDGTAWNVGVERPEPQTRRLHAVVQLSHGAIATSGDYRQFRDAGERRLAHLIDPHTGSAIPFTGASVSVVDSSAATADAWATALSVAGFGNGYELAVRQGVAALFLTTDGDTVHSRATPAFLLRVSSFTEAER